MDFKLNNAFMTELTTLRNDLIGAWEFSKEEKSDFYIADTEWICSIDPENMDFLKSIYKTADGSYSMNSLAHTIRKGYKIKGLQ